MRESHCMGEGGGRGGEPLRPPPRLRCLPARRSRSGPKLSVERAASRVGAIAGGFGGLDSPSAGLGAARAAVARATELGVPSPAAGSGGQALGSPGTTMLPAAAAGGPEVAFSPFHSISRSHAYDDEVVVARMQVRGTEG